MDDFWDDMSPYLGERVKTSSFVKRTHVLECFIIMNVLECFIIMKKVKVKVAQSCPTLCDPIDHTIQGILQAR